MKKLLNLSLAMGCILPSLCLAGEPIVHPPSAATIISTIKACSKPGYGQIAAGTKIEIKGRNIPTDGKWFWRYTGDSQCQKLPDDLSRLLYTTYEQTGRRSGAEIVAGYGKPDYRPLFAFTFQIPEGDCAEGECFYECGPLLGTEPPDRFGCELMNDAR